jgi:cysteine desulfurase/selenocysteine lyase
MSTNINPGNLPDLQELQELANQLFKAQPNEDIVLPELNPYDAGKPPVSVAGSGISPSAIHQGNAVNLQNPQTSFDDPGLVASVQPGNQPTGRSFLPLELTPDSLFHLPFQQEQPFEKQLQEILNQIAIPSYLPQIPLGDLGADPAAYYFLKDKPAAALPGFDVNFIRKDFPILSEKVNGKQLIWLDNAATTQKPRQVIDRVSYFYEHENSNIHRAAHELAARATDAYEGARKKVQTFLNAGSVNEIVFVRGATEAINLVAKSWGEQYLNDGDEIIVSHLEHHANIVPWQQLAAKKNLKIKVIPVDDDGQILLDEYVKLISPKTKLVAFTQVSNALGTVTPAAQIVRIGHSAGAKVLVDGAQSVSHMPVDVRALDADWFVFSGHKVFGPTGIGVLYGKEDLLNATQPWQGGGNMIKDVTFEATTYHNAPGRFEAGTGNIADAVGLGAAIDYLSRIGMGIIAQYEHFLLEYATNRLKQIPGLRLIGTAADKASVLSFVLNGYKTEEVGTELNNQGIAVRSGHHCAQPILRRFGVESTVRPSLAFYNTCAEIDILVHTLYQLRSKRPG